MSHASVIVVGDIVTDIMAVHHETIAIGSDTPAAIRLTGGGSAANTACWLAAAGTAAALIAVTGTDIAADDRLAELRASGVDCSFVRRNPDAPTGSIIVLAHEAERSFLCDRGANTTLTQSDVDGALTSSPTARHLHLSGYTLLEPTTTDTGRHALRTAADRGLTTSVDAASADPIRQAGGPLVLDWLDGVDILFANLDEARALTGDDAAAPETLARRLAEVVAHAVVKLAAAGAIWAHGDDVWTTSARTATVVDPTGAGDAFAAGFLTAWLAAAPADEVLAAAAHLGAAAVTVVGGRPTITPPIKE